VTEYDQDRARDPSKKFEDKQYLQDLQNSIIQFVIKYETGLDDNSGTHTQKMTEVIVNPLIVSINVFFIVET
jgi:hypothetical protein